MEKWIWASAGLYLVVMAVIDIRKREIPFLPGVLWMAGMAVWRIFDGGGWQEWLSGPGVGLILWCASILSRGGIGKGDALVYAVLGLGIGFMGALEVLILSLAMAALTGMILIVCRRAGRQYELPFIPFTTLAYALVMCL